MLIKKATDIPYSEITPKSVYLNRRKFLSATGLAGAAGIAGRQLWDFVEPAAVSAGTKLSTVKGPFSTTEKITPYKDVTHYNNFYEFVTDKEDTAKHSHNFR